MLEAIESGKVTIKILSTNEVSVTKLTEDRFKGKVIQPGKTVSSAVAEHGFAASIQIKENGESHLFLMDTGGVPAALIKNSELFKINLKDVEKLVLSHGHIDHFGGLGKVIPKLNAGTKFYLNPNCHQQFFIAVTSNGEEIAAVDLPDSLKRLEKEGKVKFEVKLPLLSKDTVQDLAHKNNIELIETSAPIELYKGVITSGEIELFDKGEATKGFYITKNGEKFEKNYFRDETSIYIHIKDKGLVVLTGCGHCGIMNTIMHGQKLTGVNKIYAVIGGFHEEWNSEEIIKKKVNYFKELNPEIICGMHCTGFNFNQLMASHPAHTLGMVGTEFHL